MPPLRLSSGGLWAPRPPPGREGRRARRGRGPRYRRTAEGVRQIPSPLARRCRSQVPPAAATARAATPAAVCTGSGPSAPPTPVFTLPLGWTCCPLSPGVPGGGQRDHQVARHPPAARTARDDLVRARLRGRRHPELPDRHALVRAGHQREGTGADRAGVPRHRVRRTAGGRVHRDLGAGYDGGRVHLHGSRTGAVRGRGDEPHRHGGERGTGQQTDCAHRACSSERARPAAPPCAAASVTPLPYRGKWQSGPHAS